MHGLVIASKWRDVYDVLRQKTDLFQHDQTEYWQKNEARDKKDNQVGMISEKYEEFPPL